MSRPETAGADRFILVAVADPAAHPEAVHVAAAAGRPIVDLTVDAADDRRAALHRHFPRAAAVIVCPGVAEELADAAPRPGVFAVAADPGPAPQVAPGGLTCPGFVVPAQAPELLSALGAALRGEASVACPPLAPAPPALTGRPGARPGEAAGAGADAASPSGPAGRRLRDARPHAPRAGGDGRVLGVLGACGGTGASTLAVAVAHRAAERGAVVLVDAVDNSGGLDLVTGDEERPGARWADLALGNGTVSGADLVAALPRTAAGAGLLTGARTGTADPHRLSAAEVTAAVSALRGEVDAVVIDLPRWGGLTEAGSDLCDLVAVVVPAEVRPVAAAARLAAELRSRRTGACLVVRHRGWSSMSADDVAELTRTPVVAEVPTVRGLARRGELGQAGTPPRALAKAADRLLGELGGGTTR